MLSVSDLEEIARKVRIDIVKMIYSAGSGHLGGSLSAVELMVGLYFGCLNHRPYDSQWGERDRVIFSKGHASALLYSVLAESGYFPIRYLQTFRKLGSLLQGHPSRNGLPGMEISTGSLGQGLSVGLGMALALRKIYSSPPFVYVLIGDGECDCGQIWEAAMAASHYKVGNLCTILDYNKLQIDGTNEEVMSLEPLIEKWEKFGWLVFEIDGHNLNEILRTYNFIREEVLVSPTLILANTVKGKGISFMEDQAKWHGKVLNEDQMKQALEELEANV